MALWARAAGAAASRDSLEEARADLGASPPKKSEARAALERAIAAGDDPAALAEAHLAIATLDEADGAFASAVAHDRASVAAAPWSRAARTAKARMGWLNDRSEGGFVPLARLMQVWSDRTLADRADAVDAFAREVETFPPGMVRGEARMFVGEAWLRHLHRPEDAKREFVLVRSDPSSSPQSAEFAERDLTQALLDEGRLDEAAGETRVHASLLAPELVGTVRERLRRRTLRRAAVAVASVIVAALTAWLLARRLRRANARAA